MKQIQSLPVVNLIVRIVSSTNCLSWKRLNRGKNRGSVGQICLSTQRTQEPSYVSFTDHGHQNRGRGGATFRPPQHTHTFNFLPRLMATMVRVDVKQLTTKQSISQEEKKVS